jgi:hypothetical protein
MMERWEGPFEDDSEMIAAKLDKIIELLQAIVNTED